MKKIVLITFFVLFATILCHVNGKKLSRSRSSSSRGSSSSRKSYNPQPTSLSNPQPAAQKPAAQSSLFGWQQKPAQSSPKQTKPSNTESHSYPSSQTGLSGSGSNKQSHYQENVQRSHVAGQQSPSHTVAQPNSGHSYPASTGLSGNSGSGAGYPQSGGLSGTGTGGINNRAQGPPPAYSNANSYPKQATGTGAGAPPPYSPGNYNPANNYGGGYHHPQGPPPPYGSYGGHHGSYNPVHTPQAPGYYGNYGSNRGFGGMSRGSSALTGVGVAGVGVGTLLTGLALWNLARSTGRQHHTVIYDNRGQPVAVAPDNGTEPVVDPILGDLVNCTLTISNENSTEVLAIPCAIATSFTPDADVKDSKVTNKPNDNTTCTVTVVTKAGREFMTTISCSLLLNTAAENNVTEPPLQQLETNNSTVILPETSVISNDPPAVNSPSVISSSNLPCIPEQGEPKDPINPCFAATQNLTVIPLPTTIQEPETTPGSA